MTETQPRGVYAAVLTPFTVALEPDRERFVRHCKWLLANGCDGLAPLGTTGEANSLSVAQRLALVEAAVAGGVPMANCIIGTGSCALADAVQVTKAVVSAGAGGALLLPPFYYKNPSEDGLFAFFSAVIDRVGDARLKLYLYHFPQLSAVPITLSLVARLKRAYGDTIAGLKDSSGDWQVSASFLSEFPGFGVFSGSEEFLLPNLRAGGVGCISASTNVTAPLARPVYLAWRNAEAEGLQRGLTEVRLVLQSYPLQAALKEVMAQVTGDESWRVLLPPNRPLAAAQRTELAQRLGALPQMQPILRAAA
jgi:4-hydroxy-tetrahydrodipicolinate synthase